MTTDAGLVSDLFPFVDSDGLSYYGRCGRCARVVDNFDELHRVTSIARGGRGVECVLRGDIEALQAGPLRNLNPGVARDD